jgi:hypothetical protein
LAVSIKTVWVSLGAAILFAQAVLAARAGWF